MPTCKQCGKRINYIKVGKKSVAVDHKEITIYVTGTQSKVDGHPLHNCDGRSKNGKF